MKKFRSDTLPPDSALWLHHRPGDFLECYSTESSLSPREAALKGLALPGWAKALLALRNTIVRPFGLKTEADKGTESIGLFPIHKDDGHEFVLGLDDKHLDFRIGVIRDGTRIFLSTWVHPHNRWGRFYLAIVMPFHVLISRSVVARMAA